MEPPLVIQTEDLHADAGAWLGERCRLVRCAPDDSARFTELLARTAGLVVRTYTRIDARLLDAAPNLRVIGRAGVGLDTIDLDRCAARGITVVYTPDANTTAVSEFVVAALFDAARPRVYLDRAMSNTEWGCTRRGLCAARQVCELTLGIYGFGRIGRRVARAAAGLGMRAVYHDRLDIDPEERHGARPVSREELLSTSDAVTIHVDGRPENRGLIDAGAMDRMKPDVILINASRGFIVDAGAIAGFMRAHPGARAVLDVHDPEPIAPDCPLWGMPNVRLSPHLAACTDLAQRNMSGVVRDVWRVLSGERPEFPAVVDGRVLAERTPCP